MKLKVWLLETRPQFLMLSVVLGFLGTCIAAYYGFFNLGYAALATLGIVLTHVSVNVLNDYFDFRSGVDLKTQRTPFSGGSGMLPAGIMTPRQVFWLGVGALLLAVPIGIYFVAVTNWMLLPLLVIAALCVVLYTPLILKNNWPEWAPGIGLGVLPVLGAFFVQTGSYTVPALIAAVPSGFLVHNLLLLNEFPDIEADKTAARRTMPISLGPARASVVYSIVTLAVYVWIIGGVLAKVMPVFALLALLTLPFAVKAIQGARKYNDLAKLIPALGSNVLVVLLTQILLGVGYILGRVI